MAILSSFEILVQPIIPSAVAPSGVPDPLVVQGYFLVLSNLANSSAVSLEFTPTLLSGGKNPLASGAVPPFGAVTAFLDTTGFQFLPLAITTSGTAKTNFNLGPGVTATFLLQPDVSPLTVFPPKPNLSYEARGFINIAASSGSQLLVSSQIRGTFLQPLASGTVTQKVSDDNASLMRSGSGLRLSSALKNNYIVVAEEAYGLPAASGSVYRF
ncbi:hypothetical protein [Anthocerotibacter panamensis]|uniref:hypothetical protein n=1 Tax=Anthocerotibacter panamensis TaxID=2857077 RepID=UPI001C404A9D|nr:hypothetical protein [Anthocerotibacter panamensis]